MTPIRCWDCDALGFTCATHKRTLPPRWTWCRHPLCAFKVMPPARFCDDHLVAGVFVCGPCGTATAGVGEPMRYERYGHEVHADERVS